MSNSPRIAAAQKAYSPSYTALQTSQAALGKSPAYSPTSNLRGATPGGSAISPMANQSPAYSPS